MEFSRRERIEQILTAEVDRAKSDVKHAKSEFERITDDVPSGLPYPEGIERIQKAGRDYRAAQARMEWALGRFNIFIIQGIVPEDLKDSRRVERSS